MKQAVEERARSDAEYLTVGEAAAYLNIPTETIYKYVRSGRLPAFKVGKHWRFTRNSIDRWLNQHAHHDQPSLRALVVDDDPGICKLMTIWLGEAGIATQTAMSGEEAVRFILDEPFHIVFMDLIMPGMNGVEAIRALRKISPGALVVVVSGYLAGSLLDDAMETGPLMVMKKPIMKDSVVTLVRSLAACGKGLGVGHAGTTGQF